jgi:hypothetical protein
MKNRNLTHSDDWQTPLSSYLEWKEKYGFCDFDPCPIDHKQTNFDGLSGNWKNRCFVNPPYNLKDKTAFIKKAIEQKKKNISSIFLLPVSTSTILFHDLILPNNNSIVFLKKRLKFEGINTKGQWVNPGLGRFPQPNTNSQMEKIKACGMHDSMLVFFGEEQ